MGGFVVEIDLFANMRRFEIMKIFAITTCLVVLLPWAAFAEDAISLRCEGAQNVQVGTRSIEFNIRQNSKMSEIDHDGREFYSAVSTVQWTRKSPNRQPRDFGPRMLEMNIYYRPTKLRITYGTLFQVDVDRYSGQAILVNGDDRISGRCETIQISDLPEVLRAGPKF